MSGANNGPQQNDVGGERSFRVEAFSAADSDQLVITSSTPATDTRVIGPDRRPGTLGMWPTCVDS